MFTLQAKQNVKSYLKKQNTRVGNQSEDQGQMAPMNLAEKENVLKLETTDESGGIQPTPEITENRNAYSSVLPLDWDASKFS